MNFGEFKHSNFWWRSKQYWRLYFLLQTLQQNWLSETENEKNMIVVKNRSSKGTIFSTGSFSKEKNLIFFEHIYFNQHFTLFIWFFKLFACVKNLKQSVHWNRRGVIHSKFWWRCKLFLCLYFLLHTRQANSLIGVSRFSGEKKQKKKLY